MNASQLAEQEAWMHREWAMWLRVVLALHIACGFTAFVCAPVALLTTKGGRRHRRWGRVYFWAMAGVAATALVLSFALPIFFLAMVSVFSFYGAFAAYRVLYLKQMYQGERARPMDWIAAIVTVLTSALLVAMGVSHPQLMGVGVVRIAGHTVSIVSVVFGLIGIRLGAGSIARFLRPPQEKMFWWPDVAPGINEGAKGATLGSSGCRDLGAGARDVADELRPAWPAADVHRQRRS